MEHKYNQLSVERYSSNLAKLLCDRYFTSANTINGQQLIAFAPVKQVNLFIIKELLQRWNQEMANLKSPFFDFEHDEVKEALVQFMNVLSRKILIRRPHFEPLLSHAIADTLLWILDPAKIFNEKFLHETEGSSADKLQTTLKYIDLNKDFVRKFLDNLPSGNLPAGNILNQFGTFLLRNKQDFNFSIDGLVTEFNNLLPLQKSDLLDTPAEPEPAAPQKPEPAFSPSLTSYFEEFESEPEEIPFPPVQPVAVAAPAPVETPPPATPKPAETAPEPARTPAPTPKPVAVETNLNERFRAEKPTLNDRLAKPAVGGSLADTQMGRKIESLKDSISINQRFSFINELFNGENMEYYNAIQTLDKFTDADSAKRYVTQDLAGKYNWSKKEEHVSKLLRLIERKFS